MRRCSSILLPMLPPECQEWMSVADAFEARRIRVPELTIARTIAIQSFYSVREFKSAEEQFGMQVVMYRLWPSGDYREWHVEAEHFLETCEEAGLKEDNWWPLLRDEFPAILK